MKKIILYVISIIVNPIYFFILQMELYTDYGRLPDGEMLVNRRSPIESLYHADMSGLFTLELFFMAVSVVSSILMLFGVKNRIAKIVQIVSTVASTVNFIIILAVSGSVHLTA